MKFSFINLAHYVLLILLATQLGGAKAPGSIAAYEERLRAAADRLLQSPDVSYVYGGHSVGSPRACQACTSCLQQKSPAPKSRLSHCPICAQCGIDCSHFTQRVYEDAGLPYPYLATAAMLSYPAAVLKKRYSLLAIEGGAERAIVGDLLVYQGHVVLLERLRDKGRGDIVHATSGRDLKGPGMGIQRERNVELQSFRGPLLRILRHTSYYRAAAESGRSLRPVGSRD